MSTAVTSTGGETEGSRRPMRADALKNQGRILEAAEEVFALQGVSAPIDMVAERAGVGVGTVYRHFPTKEALFEAIVLSRLEELASAATVSTQADDPSEAFFSFLRLFATAGVEEARSHRCPGCCRHRHQVTLLRDGR